MVFGTFDTFHPGHEYFLKHAKKYGDFLIVVIARDRTVKTVKGRLPKNNEIKRKKRVEESGVPDKVILGQLKNKFNLIKKLKPDVICLGYDQKYLTDKLESKLKEFHLKTKVIRLKSFKPHKYKSSLLKISELKAQSLKPKLKT